MNVPGLANPLAQAKVKAERIDMGVDYAGSGVYTAIAGGIVTRALSSGSGWPGPGGYVEYKITDGGPLQGRSIYVAEGVSPLVKPGDKISAGQPVARFTADQSSGTETGFAAGTGGDAAFANVFGGGYTEGQRTAAGQAMSDLIAKLGGPAGLVEGRPLTGTFDSTTAAALKKVQGGNAFTIAGQAAGSAASSAAGAIGGAIDAGKAISDFVSNPVPVLLTMALVLLGAAMVYSGSGKLLGFDQPLRATGKHAGNALKSALEEKPA